MHAAVTVEQVRALDGELADLNSRLDELLVASDWEQPCDYMGEGEAGSAALALASLVLAWRLEEISKTLSAIREAAVEKFTPLTGSLA